ncbi:hypothetical protein [Microbulbifer epialgicus]|uniref:Uncharacterized protein n=1 Tax=Microbulbifer epialgicus TaxID=393907 RepID=A0ABV4P605_9GAMM
MSGYTVADEVWLKKDQLSIAVDPKVGGRVTALRYKNIELLTGSEIHPINFGSTLWISPQSLWDWPPIAAHDSQPYQVIKSGAQNLSLEGPVGAGVSVEKHFSWTGHDLLQLDYKLETTKDFEALAAWEVTRVPIEGLAFAPVNPETIKIVFGKVDYQLSRDTLWLPLDSKKPLIEGKVIANGTEGWLAYVNNGLLYIKLLTRWLYSSV